MRANGPQGAVKGRGKPKDLQKSEEGYRRLFESSPLPMWVYDFRTLAIMVVNDAAILYYGYSRKEFLTMNIPALLPEIRPASQPENPTAAIQVRNATGICSHRRKNGQLLDVEINQRTVKFQGRQAKLMSAREITHERRVEQELRASERNYRQLFENAPQGIWVVDHEGKTIMTNRCLAKLLGYPWDEMLGASLLVWLEERAKRDSDLRVDRLKQGIPLQNKFKFIRQDGTSVYISLNTWPMKDERGRFTGTVALVADATRLKRMEEDLQASERQFRAVFDGALDPMVIVDDEGRFFEANPAACNLFGSPRHELIGRRMAGFSEKEIEFERGWRVFLECGRHNGEFRLVRPEGSVREVGFSAVTDVIPGRHLSVLQDITERKKTDEALRQTPGLLLRWQDEERRHIARELHESTAQILSALVMNLSVLGKSPARLDKKARHALNESLAMAQQSSHEVRTISYMLYPALLDEFGLVSALRHYVDGFTRRNGMRIKLEVARDFGRLAQETELALFRVVQESLLQTHSQSGSSMARILLRRDASAVTLEVKDEGRAIPPQKVEPDTRILPQSFAGMAGMHERLKALGGHLETVTDIHGTIVRVIVPVSTGDL